MRVQRGTMAPLIAIIGTDGSGKTTVCEQIVAWIGRYGPASQVHLGKQAGNVGRALARLPLIGATIDRRIRRNVANVNDRIKSEKQLTLLPALVIGAFTLRRSLRFKRMLALRMRGHIVVTDRFPQIDIPGAYDGPTFPADPKGSKLVVRLARYERAAFERMTAHQPDLVLRLNVDLDTACLRKPDHSRAVLEKKITVTPLLTYGSAPIVDIDASRPLAAVVEDAKKVVAQIMDARGYGS